MKKISVTCFLLFFFIFVKMNFPQEAWKWQNPYPHSNTYHSSIYSKLNNRVTAVGNGNSVTELEPNPPHTFYRRYFNPYVDYSTDVKENPAQKEIGVLSDNVTSGGLHEALIHIEADPYDTWSEYPFPAGAGYISSFDFYKQIFLGTGQGGIIYYTTDRGTTWKDATLDVSFVPELWGARIVNENHYQVYGDHNSCYNYYANQNKFYAAYMNNLKGDHSFRGSAYGGFYKGLNKISSDSLIILVGTRGIIVRSLDDGATFDSLNTGITTDLYGVSFYDMMHGIAVGAFGTIIYTSDGGDTWNNGTSNTTLQLNTVSFTGLDTAYAFGGDGIVLETTDGGSTWSEISSGERSYFESICFTDQNTGYVSGGGRDGNAQILKTTNGGDSWEVNFEDNPSFTFNSICFIDKDTGYTAGGKIFKTTNAGSNWNEINTGVTQEFRKILFTDAYTGYAAGGDMVLRTTDFGNTWSPLNTNSITNIYSVSFPSKDVGYVCGDGIIKTTDAGDSWTTLSLQTSYTIYSVFFTDNNKGFGVGNWGTVVKTTDGGNTWDEQIFNSLDVYYSVYFFDSNNGFITGLNYFGSSAPIYKTTDGGDTWTSLDNSPTSNSLKSVFFMDANTGYLAGYSGTILKTTNGGGVTSIKTEQKNVLPSNFELFQNYPNPFNPSTTIRYSIPKQSNVTIKIYNILGKEIETLVNKDKPAGTYQVQFNASSLTSGVYFYRITTGTFTQVNKMILLK